MDYHPLVYGVLYRVLEQGTVANPTYPNMDVCALQGVVTARWVTLRSASTDIEAE